MILDIAEKSHLRALAYVLALSSLMCIYLFSFFLFPVSFFLLSYRQQKREEQQKEWAHWDAGTPLAAFLNSPSPATLPSAQTSSHPPTRSPSHPTRSPSSTLRAARNSSSGNVHNSSRSTHTSRPAQPQKSASRTLSREGTLVKSEVCN